MGKPEGRRSFGRLRLSRKIILKWIVEKWDVSMEWIDVA